jgi:5-oxoprolinase (ATP-hydrolysing)
VNWRIAADTGGTFTDCHALDPQGRESRCKVLSTGHLRATLAHLPLPGQSDASGEDLIRGEGRGEGSTIRLSGLPPLPCGLLRGFSIRSLTHPESRLISSHDENGQITLNEPPPTEWHAGGLVELFTGEEAPVIGSRILTNTPPGAAFPPMQLRIATTRATNALLERKGSRIALFITQGFGDLLLIGDQRRPDLFALRHEPRPTFHELSGEVPERISVDGELLTRLDEAAVRALALDAIPKGITTAAVCLMMVTRIPRMSFASAKSCASAASRMSCCLIKPLPSPNCCREPKAPLRMPTCTALCSRF